MNGCFDLKNCRLCARQCGVNRYETNGFCRCGASPMVASVCVHKGEEPVLSAYKGVCNVFFAHCNLQCVFCQNIDISQNSVDVSCRYYTVDQLVERIKEVLQTSENVLGFVSPSHYAHLIPTIMDILHAQGFNPKVVYNTNAYDSVEVLQALEPYVDVYLPDFKYYSPDLSYRYSKSADYFSKASKAIKEMYRQKGSTLITADDGIAQSGLIIRHLMLPGCANDSMDVLSWIAENLSVNVHISLMSQYFPLDKPLPDSLNRFLSDEEYNRVVDYFYDLGFHRGWVQDLDRELTYKPDFDRMEAFER